MYNNKLETVISQYCQDQKEMKINKVKTISLTSENSTFNQQDPETTLLEICLTSNKHKYLRLRRIGRYVVQTACFVHKLNLWVQNKQLRNVPYYLNRLTFARCLK